MNSKKIAYGAVTCALTSVMFFAVNAMGTMKVAALFVSTLALYVLMCLCDVKTAVVSYIAEVLLLGFALSDKAMWLAYLIFFGNYAFFKYFSEKISKRNIRILLKCFGSVFYSLLIYFFVITAARGLSGKNAAFLFVLCASVLVFAGDFLLSRVMKDILRFRSDEKWR